MAPGEPRLPVQSRHQRRCPLRRHRPALSFASGPAPPGAGSTPCSTTRQWTPSPASSSGTAAGGCACWDATTRKPRQQRYHQGDGPIGARRPWGLRATRSTNSWRTASMATTRTERSAPLRLRPCLGLIRPSPSGVPVARPLVPRDTTPSLRWSTTTSSSTANCNVRSTRSCQS